MISAFKEYLQQNAKSKLRAIAYMDKFPEDKDKMTEFIHKYGFEPELIFDIDNHFSEYWLEGGG